MHIIHTYMHRDTFEFCVFYLVFRCIEHFAQVNPLLDIRVSVFHICLCLFFPDLFLLTK